MLADPDQQPERYCFKKVSNKKRGLAFFSPVSHGPTPFQTWGSNNMANCKTHPRVSGVYSEVSNKHRVFLILFQKLFSAKGQIISKANCQAEDSPKKRTNEFVFTTMGRDFVRFWVEIEGTKKNLSKLPDLQ